MTISTTPCSPPLCWSFLVHQAEEYDEGGEGVTYEDADPGKNGQVGVSKKTNVTVGVALFSPTIFMTDGIFHPLQLRRSYPTIAYLHTMCIVCCVLQTRVIVCRA